MMARTHDIERELARDHVLPVEQILGKQTLDVVHSFQTATAAILKRPTGPGPRRLPDYELLTAWRTLTKSQVTDLFEILTDPHSYWNGWPKYRRFPPRPGLAVQLKGRDDDAVLLVDLHNPGWELFCCNEDYWGFNFAGPRLTALAKAVFPECASDHSKSVWKKCAIEALEGGAS
jgi:hypothetical protein